MKRVLPILVTLIAFVVVVTLGFGRKSQNEHPTVERSTHCYAVKGADSLLLDRYAQTNRPQESGHPCLIFLFGGGFTGGDRRAPQYEEFFHRMADSGIDVLAIDYRTTLKSASAEDFATPEGFARKLVEAIRTAVDDLYSATCYTVEQHKNWGINPEQIVVMGSSAGAITALQGEFMRCNGDPQAQMLPEDFRYAGVISMAGAIFHLGDSVTWSREPAPMLLFHGNADRNVPYGAVQLPGAGFYGSEYLAETLSAAEAPHWFYSVEGADHALAEDPMYDHFEVIEHFLKSYVQSDSRHILHTRERTSGTPICDYNFTIIDYIRQNYGGE